MKKIKVTFLAICFAMTVMMLTACGSKDNTGDKSSTGGMETTQSMEETTPGTTQSGGKTATTAVDDEGVESTGVIDGLMDDMKDAVDDGIGTDGTTAVNE